MKLNIRHLCTFLVLALSIGCNGDSAKRSTSPSSGDGDSTPQPGTHWSLDGNWSLTLTSLKMHQSADCSWSSDCGYGAHPACSTIVLLSVLKTSATDVSIKVPLPGIVGDKFAGPIDQSGNFIADHEFSSSWPDNKAEGQFDEIARTVNLTVYWKPSGYNCDAEIDFQGVPMF